MIMVTLTSADVQHATEDISAYLLMAASAGGNGMI
jgi:hypothetical protein